MNNYLKTFLRGSAVSLAGAVLQGITNYLVRRILCNTLSLADYGVFYSTFSLLSIVFCFTDMGLIQTGTVMIATAAEDSQKKNRVFSQLFGLKGSLALGGSLLFLIFAPGELKNNIIFLSLFLCFFVMQVLLGTIQALWNGQKLYAIQQIAYISVAVLTLTGVLLIPAINLISAVLCFLLADFFVLTAALVYSHLYKIGRLHLSWDKKLCRQMLMTGGLVAISSTLLSLMFHTDTTMLKFIKGAESAGLYNVAQPIMQILYAAMIFPTVFLPIAAEMGNKQEYAKLQSVVRYALLLALTALFPTGIFFHYCSPWLIRILFKPEYVSAAHATTILCVGLIFFTLGNFLFQIMLSLKKVVVMAVIALFSIICNLCLNYCFILRWDINGAAFATLTSYVIFSLICYVVLEFYIRRFLKQKNAHKNVYPFVLKGDLAFHFDGDPDLPDLLKKLRTSAVETPEASSVSIICSGTGRLLKKHKWNFYKGIPWKAAVSYNGSGEIETITFYAVFFRQFLFYHLVLLPLLWRLAVSKGGFFTFGSVCHTSEKTHLLFARPGTGNTRCTFEKFLQPGCSLIGNGSLLYLPECGFVPVLDETALHYKNIAELPYWENIFFFNRLKLFVLHLLSGASRRSLSLNLPVTSENPGVEIISDSAEFAHEISLISPDKVEKLDAADVCKFVMGYLENYHDRYLNIFKTEPPLAQSAENIAVFCEKYCLKKEYI